MTRNQNNSILVCMAVIGNITPNSTDYKRCYGMDLIITKLYDTTLTSIALSVFVTNLFKIQSRILFALIYLLELIGLQPADFEPETG